ncbi:hypothetical protein [Nocardioides limicola]|uniref:hypothetical protein n=1 Tax=Nocardioides limicola TaxID=2803368 RepID=UPI00193BFE09|nr:hypothetical protein [Nocardioides sp. DJM-14]
MRFGEERPVLAGLVALFGVALAVGVILGGVVMLGAKVTGIGGSASDPAATGTGGGETLYIPEFTAPDHAGEPTVTLAPGDEDEPEDLVDPEASVGPDEDEEPESINLSASQTSVSPMGRIDLTGTWRTGEGAILMVQRFDNGGWIDFGVTASVRGQTFSTYIQTGRPGEQRFRMRDTDSDAVSNEVTVAVG